MLIQLGWGLGQMRLEGYALMRGVSYERSEMTCCEREMMHVVSLGSRRESLRHRSHICHRDMTRDALSRASPGEADCHLHRFPYTCDPSEGI